MTNSDIFSQFSIAVNIILLNSSKTRHRAVPDTGTVLLSGFILIKPDNRTVPMSFS